MKKLVCKFYYYTNDNDRLQNLTVKISERDPKVEAINTLINYLLAENKILKSILEMKWSN